MSTSTGATSRTRTAITPERSRQAAADATDPRALFDDLVFESDEICSHCYQRIRDIETHDINNWGTGNRPSETRTRIGAGEVGYDEDRRPGTDQREYRMATVCGECGRLHGRADADPITKQAALDRLPALTRRLNEQGYAVNTRVLYDTVEHLKSKPDYVGQDTEISAVATYLALKRAGGD